MIRSLGNRIFQPCSSPSASSASATSSTSFTPVFFVDILRSASEPADMPAFVVELDPPRINLRVERYGCRATVSFESLHSRIPSKLCQNSAKLSPIFRISENCDSFAEFRHNSNGILMCKDSNDTVARQPHLSTLRRAGAHQLAAERSQLDVAIPQ